MFVVPSGIWLTPSKKLHKEVPTGRCNVQEKTRIALSEVLALLGGSIGALRLQSWFLQVAKHEKCLHCFPA
jgi:hypothetical protein